jgi:hypothetical protein
MYVVVQSQQRVSHAILSHVLQAGKLAHGVCVVKHAVVVVKLVQYIAQQALLVQLQNLLQANHVILMYVHHISGCKGTGVLVVKHVVVVHKQEL